MEYYQLRRLEIKFYVRVLFRPQWQSEFRQQTDDYRRAVHILRGIFFSSLNTVPRLGRPGFLAVLFCMEGSFFLVCVFIEGAGFWCPSSMWGTLIRLYLRHFFLSW